MKRKWIGIIISLLFALTLSACGDQTDAATDAPQTDAEVIPSDTPQPAATETMAPTTTPIPTETPMPTATEVPRFIRDDFSTKSDIWGDCLVCEWRDGEVLFGPIPAQGVGPAQLWYVICEACGKHTFYRVAADVTYHEGYGDNRTFGILAGLSNDGEVLGAGTITNSGFGMYEIFNFNDNSWGGTNFTRYSAIKRGVVTNRIEITIKEGASEGYAEIVVSFNGKKVVFLYNQPAEPTRVGLYLGWHSVGVLYDNFEYEVLDPIE